MIRFLLLRDWSIVVYLLIATNSWANDRGASCPPEQLFRLLPSTSHDDFWFGHSLDVDVSHGIGVVGSPEGWTPSNYMGAAYIFDLNTGAQLFRLTASDGKSFNGFGRSVAIYQNYAVFSATGAKDGAVYVFDVSSGKELYKIDPSPGSRADEFGERLTVAGGKIFVSATLDDEIATDAGAVYIYDLETGQQLRKLTLPDGEPMDYFGGGLAVHGNIAAIAAPLRVNPGSSPGVIYIFDVETGAEINQFAPPSDPAHIGSFGSPLAMNEQYILAPAFGGGGPVVFDESYVHVYDKHTFTHLFTLFSSDDDDAFGYSVALDDDVAAVAAPGYGIPTSGGVVYLIDLTTQKVITSISDPTNVIDSEFARKVALDGDRLFIGSRADRSGVSSFRGSVHVVDLPFRRAGDIDNNCLVDSSDLMTLLGSWGACQSCDQTCPADITNSTGTGPDCEVNVFDLFLLLANWTP